MPTRVLFFLLFFSWAVPLRGLAQPVRHLEQHLDLRLYDSLESWLDRAAWLRRHLLISNGLWPETTAKISSHLSDPIHKDGYSIRKLVLETYPGFYLTGTVYAPLKEGPHPAILSAHGHWSTGRFEHSDRASIPGRAITLARQGYVVLSYSMIGYNETKDLFPHRFDEDHYQLWGFSAMGLQLWNSLRALDYLESLPEVDPNRIGMTGASGGATQTFLLTAIDQRIKAAVPVNMISSHFQGGCICENAPLLRHHINNVEIGGLAAPRPLLIVSTSGDWTVNTPDIEFPAIRNIYGLFAASELVENRHFDYPHNYNKDSREAMYDWFSTRLLDKPINTKEIHFEVPDQAELRASLPGPMPKVDELFEHVRSQVALQLEDTRPRSWTDLYAYRELFGSTLKHIFHTEHDADITLSFHFPPNRIQSSDAVLILYGTSTKEKEDALQVAQHYKENGILAATFSPYPEGANYIPPDSIQYWTTYNPTGVQRRVQEIVTAAVTLSNRSDVEEVHLHGIGEAGTWTMLARSQTPFVRDTQVDFNGIAYDTDEAFLKHLNIPLIRRAGDFKTASALIVPSSLTIKNLPVSSLRTWIETLYADLGAADMLTITP